ncbi:hypothetical protein EV192_105136 [Actinocrispum wychmicini]|uniref:Uncharacterized protein n=1 Tax=Actinocrispum wychmicini TaxID=1213861 RepID=A0A4R2JEH4_9PSEU|nr:hypothetical protein EV192_105136 [Actinocrispum wychmicini]
MPSRPAYRFAVTSVPGLRQLARPDGVVPCADCGEPAGRGYPACPACEDFVDRYWAADWLAALAGTPADLITAVLVDDGGTYPWTCLDWALRLSNCAGCGREATTGEIECAHCAIADEKRWMAGGDMTPNEHSLRQARVALRAPHRHRSSQVQYWRLVLPFLLAGAYFTARQAQRLRSFLIAGRYTELASFGTFEEMASLPDLPWREVAPA